MGRGGCGSISRLPAVGKAVGGKSWRLQGRWGAVGGQGWSWRRRGGGGHTQLYIRTANNHRRIPPPPDQRNHGGKNRKSPLGKSDRAIFGVQTFGLWGVCVVGIVVGGGVGDNNLGEWAEGVEMSTVCLALMGRHNWRQVFGWKAPLEPMLLVKCRLLLALGPNGIPPKEVSRLRAPTTCTHPPTHTSTRTRAHTHTYASGESWE